MARLISPGSIFILFGAADQTTKSQKSQKTGVFQKLSLSPPTAATSRPERR